jgi:peptide-methionine (S)-S-oxide reductase
MTKEQLIETYIFGRLPLGRTRVLKTHLTETQTGRANGYKKSTKTAYDGYAECVKTTFDSKVVVN